MGACASKPAEEAKAPSANDATPPPKETTVKGQGDAWVQLISLPGPDEETVRAGRRFSLDLEDQATLMAFLGATQDEHKKLEEFLKATRKGFVAPREGAIKKDSDMATEDSSICSLARIDSFTVAGTRAGGQRPNQDSFCIWDQLGTGDVLFAGIFDGHGPNGHYISRHVRERLPAMIQAILNGSVPTPVEQFRAAERALRMYVIKGQDLQLLPTGTPLPEAAVHLQKPIVRSYLDLDDDLTLNRSEALQIVKASSRESGTTAAVAVMWGSNALVSMVGDSVAYLVSKVVIPPRSKASGAKERAAEGPAGIPSQRASQRAGTSNRTGSASVPPGDGGRRSMDLVAAEGVLAESVPAAVAVPNAILVVNPFPHKPVGSEADRIRAAGGRLACHPGETHIMRVWPNVQGKDAAAMNYGVALSRALGDSHWKSSALVGTPDLFYIPILEEHMFLVLCSDGVSDVLSPTEVLFVIQQWCKKQAAGHVPTEEEPMSSAAEAVVAAATSAWMLRFPGHARDDITAQVVFLNGSGLGTDAGQK